MNNADAQEFQRLIDIAAPLIKDYISSSTVDMPLVDAESLKVSQMVSRLKLVLPQNANSQNI